MTRGKMIFVTRTFLMSEADAIVSKSSSAAEIGTSCHVFQSCGVNVTDATSAVTAGTPPPVMCTDAVTAAEGCAASLKRATAVPPSSMEIAAFSATTWIASAYAGSRIR